MRLNPKLKDDFNLTDDQQELLELLCAKAENTPIPLSMEPNFVKQRLPNKQKTPVWKLLSPILAAAAVCFAVFVVGKDSVWNLASPNISIGDLTPPSQTDFSEPSVENPINSDTEESLPATDAPSEPIKLAQKPAPEDPPAKNEAPEDPPAKNETPEDPAAPKKPLLMSTEHPSSPYTVSDYSNVYKKIEELNEKNPAQVKGVARSANFTAIFGENTAMLSTRETNAGDQTDTAQFDGKYIYSIGEAPETKMQSIRINKANGDSTEKTAELFVDFGFPQNQDYHFTNIRLLNCYVNQGRLTVVGSASYQKKADAAQKADSFSVITAVATYDILNPAAPRLISNVYQDGILLSSRLSGGFLYMVTRKAVPNVSQNRIDTYVPYQYEQGKAKMIAPSQIKVSEYANSPCYIVASSILLKEPQTFYSTFALLGDGSELYMNEQSLYLADYLYHGNDISTSIVKCNYSKGEINFVGETALPGRMHDSFSMDEYNDVFRIVTVLDNNTTLYTMDAKLAPLGKLESITKEDSLQSVQLYKGKAFLTTFDRPDHVIVLDLSHPTMPKETISTKLVNHTEPMIPFGQEQMIGLESVQNGETVGLKLSLYDALSSHRVIKRSDILAVEGDAYSEVQDNRQALLSLPERGLVGFSYLKYDNVKGESGCYYALYSVNEDTGIVKKVEYQHPTRVYNQRGFVKDHFLYIISSSSLVVLDINTGTVIWESVL